MNCVLILRRQNTKKGKRNDRWVNSLHYTGKIMYLSDSIYFYETEGLYTSRDTPTWVCGKNATGKNATGKNATQNGKNATGKKMPPYFKKNIYAIFNYFFLQTKCRPDHDKNTHYTISFKYVLLSFYKLCINFYLFYWPPILSSQPV